MTNLSIPRPSTDDFFTDFLHYLNQHGHPKLQQWANTLPEQLKQGLCQQRFGDLAQWLDALAELPKVETAHKELHQSVTLGTEAELARDVQEQIRRALQGLIPWRKGPYHIHGTHIDTEWRSDWKWDRLLPHIAPLKDRLVLDVGCGNGYHGWRMLGEGAHRVVGIDPSPRFVVQFQMIKHFYPEAALDVLPLGIEQLPSELEAFDTTFSMGVFYHRRSPFDHLKELKDTLKKGGELVLETLVIEGNSGEVLVPNGRYAKMNNVWFLPSSATLLQWMERAGFKQARIVDENITSLQEQRRTDWMRYHSLAEFLDPEDTAKTVEGYPAPRRAIVVAEK